MLSLGGYAGHVPLSGGAADVAETSRGLLVATGGTIGCCTRGAPATGATDGLRNAIAALADGREKGEGAGSVIAAAVDTWGRCTGLAHGTELFKFGAAIHTLILIDRHGSGPHTRDW